MKKGLLKSIDLILNEKPETNRTTLIKNDTNYELTYVNLLSKTLVSLDEIIQKIEKHPGMAQTVSEATDLFDTLNDKFKDSMERLDKESLKEARSKFRELKELSKDEIVIDLRRDELTKDEKKEIKKEPDIDSKNEVDPDKDNSDERESLFKKYLRRMSE